jgi:hypothetical protein
MEVTYSFESCRSLNNTTLHTSGPNLTFHAFSFCFEACPTFLVNQICFLHLLNNVKECYNLRELFNRLKLIQTRRPRGDTNAHSSRYFNILTFYICDRFLRRILMILRFFIFIFNLITCIRTTSWSTDDNKCHPYIKLRTCNGSVVLKIVLKKSNYISHMKMARRGRNI